MFRDRFGYQVQVNLASSTSLMSKLIKKSDITIDMLRGVFVYDDDTGRFYVQEGPYRYEGDYGDATITNKGFRIVTFRQNQFLAHRVAWAFIHDEWPALQIDHVNGDKLDNRLVNLRLATGSQNQMNAGPNRRNTSGYRGVCWSKQFNRWEARLKIGGKYRWLGRFVDKETAAEAYRKAALEVHGEFVPTLRPHPNEEERGDE